MKNVVYKMYLDNIISCDLPWNIIQQEFSDEIWFETYNDIRLFVQDTVDPIFGDLKQQLVQELYSCEL